jgi:pyruvate carboxylase subunit A
LNTPLNTTAAIYAEADSTGIYVKKADEAYVVGPGPVKGFLDGRQIVDLALRIGADAISPGYGFLSENAEFAGGAMPQASPSSSPSPDAITLMGSKVKARNWPNPSGVPSSREPTAESADATAALAFANKVGYPVIIKPTPEAAAGDFASSVSDAELRENMEVASGRPRRRSETAVLSRKVHERPHHIEFQILADRHGHIIHLGERDCSIQRRHQKLIEIAPSLILTPKLRKEMGEAAITIARAVNYDNAAPNGRVLAGPGRALLLHRDEPQSSR